MNAAMELELRERAMAMLKGLADRHYSEAWEPTLEEVDDIVQLFKQTAPEADVNRVAAEDFAKKLDELEAALVRVSKFVNVWHGRNPSTPPETMAEWIEQSIMSDWGQLAKLLAHDKTNIPNIIESVKTLCIENARLKDVEKHCELAWQVLSKQYPAALPNSPADRVHKAETELAVAFDGRDEWTSDDVHAELAALGKECDKQNARLQLALNVVEVALELDRLWFGGSTSNERGLCLARLHAATQCYSDLDDGEPAGATSAACTCLLPDSAKKRGWHAIGCPMNEPPSGTEFTPADEIASAAERAAGKVSGPAQAALLALVVELRRGT